MMVYQACYVIWGLPDQIILAPVHQLQTTLKHRLYRCHSNMTQKTTNIKSRRILWRCAGAIASCIYLSACGYKGPLYLPDSAKNKNTSISLASISTKQPETFTI